MPVIQFNEMENNIMKFSLHPQLEKDSITLGSFELSRLLLLNDSQFPWFALVPEVADISEVYQLSQNQQQLLWQESDILSKIIIDFFKGDKLNIAAIGNLVPQLHVHHVVRYKNDPCWPAPIWGKLPMVGYQAEKVEKIRQNLLPVLIKSGLTTSL